MTFNDSGERVCPLCARTSGPFSPEHVPPIWHGDFIRQYVGPEGIQGRDGSYKDRADATVEVCLSCNKWMNEWIEEPARDLVKQLLVAARSLTSITRAQQTHLATWLAKTAMLEALTHPHPTVPLSEIRYLHAHGVPSDGTTIWIGQASPEVMRGPTPQNIRPKEGLVRQVVIPRSWNRWVRDYLLVYQIVITEPADSYGPIELPIEAQACLTRIWPPREDVIDWPPPVVIDRPTEQALESMVVSQRLVTVHVRKPRPQPPK